MKIRPANIKDIPELLRMGESFFNASGYGEITTFNRMDSEDLLLKLIEADTILTDGKTCMLAYVVFPMFMNSSYKVAQELFWWVDENHRKGGIGIELLKATEKKSKEQGAKTMMMLSLKELDGDKVNKIYSRMGYKPREQTYMRVL